MRPTAPFRPDAGVTLLEMLVVLAILASASVIGMSALRSARGGDDVLRATNGLAAAMRSVRAQAMRESRPTTLYVDLQLRTYWTEPGARRQLPAGLSLASRVPDGDQISPTLVRLRFEPDGSAADGSITVSDGTRRSEVQIRWPVGGIHVVGGS
jgi:general secretion pathway protein H